MSIREKFFVTVIDTDDDSEHQVEVEVERHKVERLDGEAMIDAAIDISIEARKKYAATLVDYDSFGSDSAYLDRIDKIADDRLTIGSLTKAGEMTPFLVDGVYSDDQLWSDRIDGVDAEDAAFSARWIMAVNEGARPKEFESFLDTMLDQKVFSCRPDPVSFDDLLEMIRTHVSTQPNAPDFVSSREALIEAIEKIDSSREAIRIAQDGIDNGLKAGRNDAPSP